MEEIFLDGYKMISKSETHKYIKKMLNFPDYYGGNLDALWDILSTKSKLISIFLLHEEKIYENLGDYGKQLIDVFQEAANSNTNIKITLFN